MPDSTFLIDWEDGGEPETYQVPSGFLAAPERNQVALCPQCRGEGAEKWHSGSGGNVDVVMQCRHCHGRGVVTLVAVVPAHPPAEEPG